MDRRRPSRHLRRIPAVVGRCKTLTIRELLIEARGGQRIGFDDVRGRRRRSSMLRRMRFPATLAEVIKPPTERR